MVRCWFCLVKAAVTSHVMRMIGYVVSEKTTTLCHRGSREQGVLCRLNWKIFPAGRNPVGGFKEGGLNDKDMHRARACG
jgi:hypothetical protein